MPWSRFRVSRTTRLVDILLPPHVFELPPSSLQRIRLAVGTALLFLAVTGVLTPLTYLFIGDWGPLIFLLIGVPLYLCAILSPRWSRSDKLPGTLVSLVCLGLMLAMASTQQEAVTLGANVSLILVPLLVTLLAGRWVGLACTVVAMAWLLYRLTAVAWHGPPERNFEMWGLIAACWVTPVVWGLTWLYENFRQETERATARAMELALANAKLAHTNEELERFAYVASHDMQEPLRLVVSYTQLLARRYRDKLDASADEFIGYAVYGAKRMQHIIQDLVAYSQVSSAHTTNFRKVATGPVLERVIENLEASARECGARITADPLPVVEADESQLEQVFQQLLSNALKFRSLERAPRIHVSAQRQGEEGGFSVRDNGIGVERQYFERIFAIFQRLHAAGRYEGTGMGLAVCKRIVELHGGRIWVESRLGEGATFRFTLRARHLE